MTSDSGRLVEGQLGLAGGTAALPQPLLGAAASTNVANFSEAARVRGGLFEGDGVMSESRLGFS